MNIVTIPISSKSHYIRPDTSYNKDHHDYFCPNQITALAAVPFIYVRIDKAAKAVSAKFAPRYYSSIGYGVRLLAPELIVPGSPETWWMANSLDLTTYFNEPVDIIQTPKVLETVSVYAPGLHFLTDTSALIQKINSSFEAVTPYTSLKTGDYLTIDLLSENTFLLTPDVLDILIIGEIKIRIIW